MKDSLYLYLKPNKEVAKICRKYGITILVLFGSYAARLKIPATSRRNLYRANHVSDIDIGYIRRKELSDEKFSRFQHELAGVFHINAERLDLSDLTHANPLLQYQALVKGKLVYGKQRDFTMKRLYAVKLWQDNAKFFELTKHYVKQRI